MYINFNTFYTLYQIAPDKWEIDGRDGTVSYEHYWFYMKTPLDWCRLILFYERKNKENKIIRNNNKMEIYIKKWQKDIDEFKKERQIE